MVLIHNKKRRSCFQLVIQGHLGISRLHPKTVKRLLSRNQVCYQFVSAPYMGVHIATEGCLEKLMLKKLEEHWTNRSQIGRSALKHRAVSPFLWMFLPVWQAVHPHIYQRSILKKSIVLRSTGQQRAPGAGDSLGQERRGSPGAEMTKVRDG